MSASTRKLWVLGAGGLGSEVLHSLRGVAGTYDIAFADSNPKIETYLGRPVHHQEEIQEGNLVVIAVGDGKLRKQILSQLQSISALPFKCIAPTAIVGEQVSLGEGALLADNTMITANATIGVQFQCNIYSYVAHDCVIGDYVTFAPRVSCNGNVEIGDYAYIGTGAVLKPGRPGKPLRIGEGAIVGMGAVVTKDVPPRTVVVGNPARPLEK